MSSSDSDDLEGFFASLRSKKAKETYRLSSGSLKEFVIEDDHVSFDENSEEELEENISESDLKTIQEAVSILQLSSNESSFSSDEDPGDNTDNNDNLDNKSSSNFVEERCLSDENDKGEELKKPSPRKSLCEKDNNIFIGSIDGEVYKSSDSKRLQNEKSKVSASSLVTNETPSKIEKKKAQIKNLDALRRRGSFTPKRSTASSSSKKTVLTPKIIFSSSDSDEDDMVFSKDVATKLNIGKDPLDSFKKPSKNHVITNSKKSSRILLLSDDEEDDNIEVGSHEKKLESSSDTTGKILQEFDHKTEKTGDPTTSNGISTNLSHFEDEANVFQDSPLSFPNPKTSVTSSAKKSSRILVLSDDSDSDLDNDVIFVDDDKDDDKENFLNDNICESPDLSDSHSNFDSVFTPELNPKKIHPALRDLDSDEEYIPLAARILGGNSSSNVNDSVKPKRKVSEPGFCKPLSTPSFSKPSKSCFSERPPNKSRPVISKSNGIPPNLPTNCNKGPAFKRQRDFFTKQLYEYFNKTIFMERLPQDMIVEWDKRLTKTAGVTKCSSRTVTTVENGIRCIHKTYKATISLSEKVLDTLERLRETLCHEMCHAAVWVLDNQNDGHGPFWKAWARKATAAHPGMPVVKRCHSYDITYKFQYQCLSCRKIYGRHSKSIKVDKQACGVCRGKLVLLPPKNSDGTPAKPRQANKFAMFVKDNYKQTKQAKIFDGMTPKHSDVMKALSEQFASLSTKL